MSVYAYFACEDCKEYLWLGKVVRDARGSIDRFAAAHGGQAIPNSQQPLRTRASWKMLAQHSGHRLIVEDEREQVLGEDLREIGGSEAEDIPFEQYLAHFEG